MRRAPLAPRPLSQPDPSRLDPAHPDASLILGRHDAALAAGDSTYLDPTTGYDVFTAAWLAARGTCCDSGCRHCPYEPS